MKNRVIIFSVGILALLAVAGVLFLFNLSDREDTDTRIDDNLNELRTEIEADRNEVEELKKELVALKDDVQDNAWDAIPKYEAVNKEENDTWQVTPWEQDEAYTQKSIVGVNASFPDITCLSDDCEIDLLNNEEVPNSYVEYATDTNSFKVPFNAIWGNDDIALAPYKITNGSDISWKEVVNTFEFGPPIISGEGSFGWHRSKFTLDIADYSSAVEVYTAIEKGPSFFVEPHRTRINGYEVLRYSVDGLGRIHVAILFAEHQTITISSASAGFEKIEDILRTVTTIQ